MMIDNLLASVGVAAAPGINPPLGAVGTGGSKTATIVKTSDPAIANTGEFFVNPTCNLC